MAALRVYLKYVDRYKEGWNLLEDTTPIGALALATTAVFSNRKPRHYVN